MAIDQAPNANPVAKTSTSDILLDGLFTGMIGALRRGYNPLVKYNLMALLYWYLMSFAAWKGFMQLFRNPFYWEKTVHGLYTGPLAQEV